MEASRSRSERGLARVRHVVLLALLALGVSATTAAARTPNVEIVKTGSLPVNTTHVHYFNHIQEAVNATKRGDWVLIENGTYPEEVKVTHEHSGIWIRGMDRNGVVLDGEHQYAPEGRNGIEVYKANDVYVENLTVKNFDRPSLTGPGGNEIWWNGGGDSKKIGAHGWWGKYLTAYDDGFNGGYGIFTNNEIKGEWNHIYASGFNDSGIYLGACQECKALINDATMENNALGYSGSNSGGNLVIQNSIFRKNSVGIAPNAENPGDGPPPQNGQCNRHNTMHPNPTPHFASTNIERCTILRKNLVTENGNLTTPSSTARAPWGAGIELPGDYADLVEENTITNNPKNGVLGFEYPNPYPPVEGVTIYFELAGNKIANNTFSNNGYAGGSFAGDVTISGGIFGKGPSQSTQNCLSGNSFADATYPAKIEETWGCQNATTPNPNLGFAGIEYLLELQAESEIRTSVPQPVPGPQTTMPNACVGVPTNPLCP